jgi:plasmid maintenance system antidote protein VapI
MAKKRDEYQPDYVSPPGDTLRELLAERAIGLTELAEKLRRHCTNVEEMLCGTVPITEEIASDLEHLLGVSASFWLLREKHYREFLARQAIKASTE